MLRKMDAGNDIFYTGGCSEGGRRLISGIEGCQVVSRGALTRGAAPKVTDGIY